MSSPQDDAGSAIEPRLTLTAYEQSGRVDGLIEAAPVKREWMEQSIDRFAYRCLPLVIANQSGWIIRNRIEFGAIWNGKPEMNAIEFGVPMGDSAKERAAILPEMVKSHFGGGIITFVVPFVFRTPPGYNLWVRGPINEFKDAIQALDGMVETDWLQASFTMNWKFTRPNTLVHFKLREPICQVLPYPRGLLERIDPVVRPIHDDPELLAGHEAWRISRGAFISDLDKPGSEARERKWQKDYFQGKDVTGARRREHQTKLDVKEFVRVEPSN